MKKVAIKLTIAMVIAVLTTGSLVSCNQADQTSKADFGIYLADSEELVLSGNDIESFSSDDGRFKLNENGIEKWNSFQTYPDIPKLKDSLYNRDFIIRISGEELCQGTFWSMASSSLYSGYIIGESLSKLDADTNTIRLGYWGTDPQNSEVFSELKTYFK